MRGAAQQMLAGYYAHCSALDDCVGQLRRTLAETGLAENTLFVFTADHGDMLGSHGQRNKQQPYEESIRVPLLFCWPAGLGRHAGRPDAPLNSEDLMPTLLGLCGIAIPKSVEGLDYSGYLRGGRNPSDNVALVSCPVPFGQWIRRKGGREYRGVRTPRSTYVRDLHGPWLLFDNQADPYQLHNLVGRSRPLCRPSSRPCWRKSFASRGTRFSRPAIIFAAGAIRLTPTRRHLTLRRGSFGEISCSAHRGAVSWYFCWRRPSWPRRPGSSPPRKTC
jgi:hypothetical protein